jgi:hypothetical protein
MKRFHYFFLMLTVSNCTLTAMNKRATDGSAVEALDGLVSAQVQCVLLCLAAGLRIRRLDEYCKTQQGSVGGRVAQCI